MTKPFSIILFTIVLIFTLESCNNNINAEKLTPATFQPNDSLRYKQLKDQFYTDKFGKLFEQKEFARRGRGDFYDTQIYYDSVVLFLNGDSSIEKPLSEIIDLETFTKLDNGTAFSKDKNYVYYSYFNTSGSRRIIVNGANPKTFKPLSDYQYGMDDKHIFYQSKMINGLNFNKYEILYSLDTTDHFIDYVKDDKVVFYKGDTVKGADAKTFKLVADQQWSAEDKNYKYECCGQRFAP
jgi:DKNYY family